MGDSSITSGSCVAGSLVLVLVFDFHISPAVFDEVSAEVGRTLDHFKVPQREKEETLAAFNAHKAEVSAGSKPTVGVETVHS